MKEYLQGPLNQATRNQGSIISAANLTESHAPLWHRDPQEYMEEIIDLGFEVIITSVSAEGLDESWLGQKLDKDLLNEIIRLNRKYRIHMAFEVEKPKPWCLTVPCSKTHKNSGS